MYNPNESPTDADLERLQTLKCEQSLYYYLKQALPNCTIYSDYFYCPN